MAEINLHGQKRAICTWERTGSKTLAKESDSRSKGVRVLFFESVHKV